MSTIKERTLKILGIGVFFVVLLVLPSIASLATAENIDGDQVGSYFVWIMFPSWVYLGGAIVMLVLGIKYMAGGALSRPFTLMGFALLADAIVQLVFSLSVINLIPKAEILDQVVFGVTLLFRLSVVFSMVWIGSIFGVLRSPSTPTSSSNPPTGA